MDHVVVNKNVMIKILCPGDFVNEVDYKENLKTALEDASTKAANTILYDLAGKTSVCKAKLFFALHYAQNISLQAEFTAKHFHTIRIMEVGGKGAYFFPKGYKRKPGNIVSFNVTPPEGMYIHDIEIPEANLLQKTSPEVHTFIMPDMDVTVIIYYRAISKPYGGTYLMQWSETVCLTHRGFYNMRWSNTVCIYSKITKTMQWSEEVCVRYLRPEALIKEMKWSDLVCVRTVQSYTIEWSEEVCITQSIQRSMRWTDTICTTEATSETTMIWSDEVCVRVKPYSSIRWSDEVCVMITRKEFDNTYRI